MKKLVYIIAMIWIISVISFVVVHLAPNSFFASGELNPNITPEALEHLKSVYGLDKSLIEQYFSWLKSVVLLDFGISFASGEMVRDEILERLPITLTLNLLSIFLSFVISIYFGIQSAIKQETKFDRFTKQLSLVSFSMPSFYLALILILLFAVEFKLFPITYVSSNKEGLSYLIDMLYHLFLPIFVIVFGSIGGLILYVRSLTLEILKSDYIFFAKARGVDSKTMLFRFILPNIYPPLITLLGLSLPSVIGGSVILESIFSINGMGLLFYQSAMSKDYPVIMGILIIGAFLTLLGNILADLVLLKINPHFKRGIK